MAQVWLVRTEGAPTVCDHPVSQFLGDCLYSPVKRNSACHWPSVWTTSQ
jgi:hypothetical protein